MRVIGITGGIGSGKSYVSRVFGLKGIPVYNSDEHTKQLYKTDISLIKGLAEILGEDILIRSESGGYEVDKVKMAQKIFSNDFFMARVREFVYPYVMKDFMAWKKEQKAPFVLFESAVLLENEYVKGFVDKVLVVWAPLECRIKRVVERDRTTVEQALSRISSQWSDEKRFALADYIVESDDEKDENAILEQLEKFDLF